MQIVRPLAALAATLVLGGCFGFGGSAGDPGPAAIVTQEPLPTQGEPAPEVSIGDGSVPVVLLLPLTAGGSASGLGQAFQNAAALAMADTPTDTVRIFVRDDGGDTERARLAAERAVAEGAKVILGPVFAPAVEGAAGPARAADVPLIAFSTDASLAGRNVYLLSFLPRQDATRIVSFAAERGVRTFAGLVPDDGYGLVMEAAFREAVASAGGRVTAVERYAPGEIAAAADRAFRAGAVEALFVPNGGDDPGAAAAALGPAHANVRLLGSGQWDNRAVLGAPGLAGAWYPAPDATGFAAFARRYGAKYGAAPPRTASLVYDAVLLANGLAARGPDAFSRNAIEVPDGFLGVDGIFRLAPGGLSERGLAVFEVGAGGATAVVSPAPQKFAKGF